MKTRKFLHEIGFAQPELGVSWDTQFNIISIWDIGQDGEFGSVAYVNELDINDFKISKELGYDFYLLIKEYAATPIGER